MWVVYGVCIHLNFNDLFYQDWRNFISTLRFCAALRPISGEWSGVPSISTWACLSKAARKDCCNEDEVFVFNAVKINDWQLKFLRSWSDKLTFHFSIWLHFSLCLRKLCQSPLSSNLSWKLFFFELALTFLLAKAISAPRSSDGKELNDIWRVNRQNIQLSFIFDWYFIFCFSVRPLGKAVETWKLKKQRSRKFFIRLISDVNIDGKFRRDMVDTRTTYDRMW